MTEAISYDCQGCGRRSFGVPFKVSKKPYRLRGHRAVKCLHDDCEHVQAFEARGASRKGLVEGQRYGKQRTS